MTDDAAELRTKLQAVTGERIAALEAIGEMKRAASGKAAEPVPRREKGPKRGAPDGAGKDRQRTKAPAREPKLLSRQRSSGRELDLGR